MSKIDKETKAEITFKAFEAKMILRHNLVDNKKPKTLEAYLNKVARTVGYKRENSDID